MSRSTSAEYDDEISSWLTEGQYRTSGEAQGGINAVRRYYESAVEILDRHQLFACSAVESRTGEEPVLSENALTVLRARYLLKDDSGKCIETPGQLFSRVAETIAKAETKYGRRY